MGDFKAFYCAGYTLAHHQNPYAAVPLSQCEALAAPKPLFVAQRGQILPAPLPGYAIAAFVPFSILPFPAASALWLLLLIAATAGAIALFQRASIASADLLGVTLALILVAVCFPVGELPPIALLGVALATWSASHYGRPWMTVCGIALAFCEPQVGAALFVTALALGRRFALPTLAAVSFLAVVSLLAVGVGGNIEYLRIVVPAHVASELPSVLQYSLSAVFYQLGVPASGAIMAGRLSWFVMLGVAFIFARSKHVRSRPKLAFLAVPAFVAVGGPFLHLDHIALAIPAALWVASNAEIPVWFRVGVVAALALPVLYVFSIIQLAVLVPFIAAWIGREISKEPIGGLRTVVVVVVTMLALGILSIFTGTGSIQALPATAIPKSIAQASWARYIADQHVMTSWSVWLVKAPIWCGILATAGAILKMARGRVTFAS
jgi:hypothetical protein